MLSFIGNKSLGFSSNALAIFKISTSVEVGEDGVFISGGYGYVKRFGNGELISINGKFGNLPIVEDTRCMGRVLGRL